MGRHCEGGCNRYLEEYYILKNGAVYCYDCWVRARNHIQTVISDNCLLYQEDLRRHREKELQYYSYLDNPTFHSREMAQMEEEEKERNERKQKEYEQETISDAKELFKTVKQQTFTPGIKEDATEKIGVISKLLKKNTFQTSLEALNLMNKKYVWPLYKNDSYRSALYNITEKRHEFIKEREEVKKKTQELYEKLKQQKTVNNAEELKMRIGDIEAAIKKETYNGYKTAIDLLEKEYEWEYKKETFKATLFDIDTAREEYAAERNKTINEARILFDTLFSSVKMNEQVEKIKTEIGEKLNNETYNDSKEAIKLLNMQYSWKTKKGSSFEATLSELNERLAGVKKMEKKHKKAEIKRIREEWGRKQKRKKSITAYELKIRFWKWVGAGIIAAVVFLIIIITFIIKSA